LPGDGTADLNVTITNGMVTSVAYRTSVDGRDAAVETAVETVADLSPSSADLNGTSGPERLRLRTAWR
jgi:hypothetical protein